jgi:hypothetical protein
MARRTLAAALLALAALSPAAIAFAHEGNKDYESIVRNVKPAIPGFSVEVLNGDDRLEVANRGSATVTIDGYDAEPYLRMAPDGTVAVNLNSPAYYLNQERLSTGTVPPSVDATDAPRWKVVEHSGRFEFHDHRMHWMGTSTPKQVKDTSARTKIFDWSVPVHTASATGAIDGELFWRGSSSSGAPVGAFAGLALIVLLGAASVVVVRRRRAAAGGGDGDGDGAGGPVSPREEAW